MSLLDDVSIVVTPNGYKAGELYAVIPVPTEGAEEVPSIIGILNAGGGTITQISGNSYSSTSDGTSGSGIRPKFDFNTTAGKRYKLTITPTGTISGTINFDFYDGSSYLFQNYDFTTTKEIYFIDNGSVFGAFDGAKTYDVSSFTVSVKEYTSADMDVTRATAATRVDENGLVNYAEVLGGEEVDNGDFATDSVWAKGVGWTISGGTAISDGTQVANSSLASSLMSVTSGILLKVVINIDAASSGVRLYDSNGVVDYGMAVGENVYYRTAPSSSYTLTIISFVGSTATINNVSVKEIQRDNVPRIDYTGGGCPHILAEPMRTNLIPYSEEISQYSETNTTVINNNTTSPDGTVNASKVTKDGANANDRVYINNFVILNATDYSLSVFIKNDDIVNGGVSTISARISGGTLFRQGYEWNGSTLSITSSQASGTRTNVLLEDYGNGWWKVGFSFTSDGTSADIEFDLDRINGTDTTSIFLWGTQLEVGSYSTSYIPNFGTALGVTRNQDIFTRDGIGSLINSTEGVLFVEMAALSNDGTYREISLNDGTTNNVVEIRYTPTDNQFQFIIRNGGAAVVNETITLSNALDFNKIAFSYKSNDYKMYVNGVQVATDTSGAMPSGLDTLSLEWGGNYFYGKLKQLQVYDTSLSDEQLLQLTGESGTDFYESYAEMASALTYTIQ